MSPQLILEKVTLGYGNDPVVRDLSLRIPPGRFTIIIGPNGCGKSTLLKSCARLLRPQSGRVLLDGQDVQDQRPKQLARKVAFLPQTPVQPSGISVFDLVARGRFPHQSLLQQWSPADSAAVEEALQLTGMSEAADRRLEELSGGQRQRVWVAMVLAQQAQVVLLDEPTTYLDLSHQIGLLELFRSLQDAGRTVVAVLHELTLAASYADHLVVMQNGRIAAQGTPDEVIRADLLREVFDLECRVMPDPDTGAPLVLTRGRAATGSGRI